MTTTTSDVQNNSNNVAPIVDLRSDTLTQPSEEMRQVMARAPVGDDVWNEDPVVKELQTYAAALCGKEAALFVPSGTMGNLCSVLSHCQRGDEIILGDMSHVFLNERGGSAALAGVHSRTVANLPDGTMDLTSIRKAIRKVDIHFPSTRLIILEQTHNFCGGRVVPVEYINAVCALAHQRGLLVHMDGARLFNACVALGISAKDMLQNVDSCTFCLSKGLGAPIGSVIVGTASFIASCKQWRKALGGGMRQVGVIASAGLYALQKNVSLLQHDHDTAQTIARYLLGQQLRGLVHVAPVDTNIVIFTGPAGKAASIASRGRERGVLVVAIDDDRVRAVTHLHISKEAAEQAGRVLVEVVQEVAAASAMSNYSS